MKLHSTRGATGVVNFQDAVFQGLAPDGGLYQQTTIPDLRDRFEAMTSAWSFRDIAADLIEALIGDELKPGQASLLAEKAFPFGPELKPLADGISILELFHGPSCAFKDFGASFLAKSMEVFLGNQGRKAVILTATSGDTGSAVAQAFHGAANIDVVILYPSGRVSPLQEKQLTTLGGNVHALEVKGSFDDCQRMVKEAFVDPELRDRLVLSSANSINIGRLLPQSFYYVWARSRFAETQGDMLRGLPDGSPFVFCVPSGNFGNLTAGLLAWTWGMHVDRFVAATNANDVVPEYLRSSAFTPRPSVHTWSNAMDVGNPSNFERMLDLFGADHERMRLAIASQVISDADTLSTMTRIHRKYGEILDPHTAVAVLASERFLEDCRNGADSWYGATTSQDTTMISDNTPKIVALSTAHPGKFVETVQKACGVAPELPEALRALLDRKKVATPMGNNLAALKSWLLGNFAG